MAVRGRAEAEAKKHRANRHDHAEGRAANRKPAQGDLARHTRQKQQAQPPRPAGGLGKSPAAQAIEVLRQDPAHREEMEALQLALSKQQQATLDTTPISQQLQSIEVQVGRKKQAAVQALVAVGRCQELLDQSALKLAEAKRMQAEIDKELGILQAQLQAKADQATATQLDPHCCACGGHGDTTG